MLTTVGSPVEHALDILALLEAVLLPRQVTVTIAQAIKKERAVLIRETGQPMKLQEGKPYMAWEDADQVNFVVPR
jgi:hypothetical protein